MIACQNKRYLLGSILFRHDRRYGICVVIRPLQIKKSWFSKLALWKNRIRKKLSDDQFKVTFRFSKNPIYDLKETLNIPEEIKCYNNARVDGAEALCAVLKRFAYPWRFIDMIYNFARPVPQLSKMCNQMTN